MRTLWILTKSNIKMFVRNRQALFFTLFMPIIIMGVFGLLGFDNVPEIRTGIALNAPPTEGTKQFIEQVKQIEALEIHEGTERDERVALEEGERSAVILVPWDLIPENPAQQREPKTLTVLTNAGDAQQAQIAVAIISQFLDKTTIAMAQAPTLFELQTEEVNSRNLEYFDFLLPGVVALSIMQMSVFSVAFVFADYKEKGVLKRLIATPMKPWQFVTANVITRLIVAVFQSAILIAVGVLLFDAQMIGSMLLVLLSVFLGAIMFLGLGFTISGFANTVESVPAIANIIVFPMLFLGGTFFPISSMPEWLQGVVNWMPLTHLSHALREIMTNGAGFAELQTDFLWMIGWAVVLVVAANFSFRFEEKRQ